MVILFLFSAYSVSSNLSTSLLKDFVTLDIFLIASE